MGVASADAAFAQPIQHGDWIDGEVSGDFGKGPAEVVEVDRFVNLFGGQATSSHRNVVTMQYRAHGSAVDTESVAELICCRARKVALGQALDLVWIEWVWSPWWRLVGAYRRQRWPLVTDGCWIVTVRQLVERLVSGEFDEYRRDLFDIGRVATDTMHTKFAPSSSGVVRSCHTTILGPRHVPGCLGAIPRE